MESHLVSTVDGDENNAQGKDFLPWVNIQRKDRRQEANYEYTTI
jgi:hypothetical protein